MNWKEYLTEEKLTGFTKLRSKPYFGKTLANIGLDDVYYNKEEDKFYNDTNHNDKKVALVSIKNKYALEQLNKIKIKANDVASRASKAKLSGKVID